jgi:hypothetical protein
LANQFLTQELLNILQSLEEKEIIAVPFKGPLLAEQLYKNISLRIFRDLDFLIQKKDISATLKILKNKSYRIEGHLTPKLKKAFWDYAGQDIFHRYDRRVSIEPHWAFAPKTLAINIDYRSLFQRIERTTLQLKPIYSFSCEDTLIILCVHGSKELWVRLKWICDIAQFLETYPKVQWDIVVQRAAHQGCLRMVYVGLLLAHQILDSTLPDYIKAYIENDKTIKRLVHQVKLKLVSEKVKDIDVYQLNSFRWYMRESREDRLCYLFRTLTTPRIRHFSILNLPDSLYWGYYPIKIAHDYCLEPAWSLIKAGLKNRM